jgi:hypothetical protein
MANRLEKIARRCESIEKAFLKLKNEYVISRKNIQGSDIIDLDSVYPNPEGFNISPVVLVDAIHWYFKDIDRYKKNNGFKAKELANPIKVGAFSCFWLASKCPIYDVNDTIMATQINNTFAIYAGFTLADIDPYKAFELDNSLPYKQLDQILSNKTCTSDALVPIFQLFKNLVSR